MLKKTLSEMLGWIRIYGHPCAGPAGPARALAGNRKSKKRKENIWIQALKTKPIRTALKFLKNRKIVHPNRPSIQKVRFLAGTSDFDFWWYP